LEIAILGLCISLFTVKKQRALEIFWSPAFLVMLLLLGLHWSMREEAALLLPAVWILTCGALWVRSKDNLRYKAALIAVATLLVLLPGEVAYFGVVRLNRASYGVSLANEISEGSFPRAVGALKSVQESPCDHTLMTADETQKILAVSPSFAGVGNVLKAVVSQKPDITYTDAFAIMRISALQDETIRSSPLLTQDLFTRIANEVQTACKSGALKCAKPASSGIVPLLCRSQWSLVSSTFIGYLTEHIARLSDSGLSPLSSRLPGIGRLSPSMLGMFEEIAAQKMAGRDSGLVEYSQPASLQLLQKQDFRRWRVADLYRSVMPWLMAIGACILSLRLLFWSDRERPWTLIILVALAGHVLCRAAAFSYLSAVDGYLNNRYISVCYPVAAAFAALASSEWIRIFHSRRVDLRGIQMELSQTRARGFPLASAIVAVLVGAGFIYAGSRSGIPLSEPEPVLLEGKLNMISGHEYMTLHGQPIQLLNGVHGWLGQEAGGLLGESAIFDGWCKDVANDQPAKALLIYADGQLINESPLSVPWIEVEGRFPEGAHAGFNVSVPRALIRSRKVRFFALLTNNRAGELGYPPSFPYPH
jgi:uncharacterized membrane protein YjjB (DUF3815 family)